MTKNANNNYCGAPVKLRCTSCAKVFTSEVLIRNGEKVVYKYCPVCRKKRINYNNTILTYTKMRKQNSMG